MRVALVLVLVLGACASSPPPPREDTALLARMASVEGKLEEVEKARTNLILRLAALEAASATRRRPDDDLVARIAGLETKLALLEDRITLLEMAKSPPVPPEPPATVVDRKKDPRQPAPGEVVKPLAAIDGESFSFVRGGAVDLARLVGVEAPVRGGSDELLAREKEAWGAAFDADAAAAKVRARLEELLTSGELSFTYADAPSERRGLPVYAQVKNGDRSECVVNEVLLREGLVLARGVHARSAEFEKLEAEARAAKRGFFGGTR